MSLLSPLYCLDAGTLTTRLYGVDRKTLDRVPTQEEGAKKYKGSLLNLGRVTDEKIFARFLRHNLPRTLGGPLGIAKPRFAASVPACFSQVEKIALAQSLSGAGAGSIRLVSTGLAAAAGCGVDLNGDRAAILLGCGFATSELAVILSGSQIFSEELDLSVASFGKYLERKLEEETGARFKLEVLYRLIGLHSPLANPPDLELSAKFLESGKFGELRVPGEVYGRIGKEFLLSKANQIGSVLNGLPAELASDILEQGMILYGGMSKMKGLSLFLSGALSIPVSTVLEPEDCVIKGLKDLSSSISFDEIEEDPLHIEVLGCD